MTNIQSLSTLYIYKGCHAWSLQKDVLGIQAALRPICNFPGDNYVAGIGIQNLLKQMLNAFRSNIIHRHLWQCILTNDPLIVRLLMLVIKYHQHISRNMLIYGFKKTDTSGLVKKTKSGFGYTKRMGMGPGDISVYFASSRNEFSWASNVLKLGNIVFIRENKIPEFVKALFEVHQV